MATQNTRKLARGMLAPSVIILFIWMIVPLVLTLWYSFQNYVLTSPMHGTILDNGFNDFAGWSNYFYFITDPSFIQAFINTIILVVGVLLGMVQAATSINEQTLSFVPKLIITAFCLAIFGSSILVLLTDFTKDIFAQIPNLVR